MTVDITARPVTATITILDEGGSTISGPHDVGDAIAAGGFGIDFPQLNTEGPNGYSPFKATLNLRTDITGFGLNLDPRSASGSPSGAALLAQGNKVNIQIARSDRVTMDAAWPDLYILKVSDPPNLPSPTVSLSLGDRKQLQNLKTPEGNEAGFNIGTTTTRRTIINNYLSTVDIPATSDSLSSYSLSAPPQKVDQESWTSEAGKVAGTAGYYLWTDSSNATRLTAIDLDQSSPALSLTIGAGGDEVKDRGWLLVSNDERPPRELTVYGQGGLAEEVDNPLTTTTQRGEETLTLGFGASPNSVRAVTEQQASNEILTETCITKEVTETITSEDDDDETITVTIVQPTEKTINTDTTLRDSLSLTHTKNYSNLTKALESELVQTRKARGLAGGDAWRLSEAATSRTANGSTSASNDFLDAYDLIDVEERSVTYEYSRLTGRLTRKVTRIYRPWCLVEWTGDRPINYELDRLGLREVERKTEEWEEVTGLFSSTEKWQYKYSTLRPRGVIEAEYEGVNAEALIEDYRRLEGDYAESDVIVSGGDVARPPDTDYQSPQYDRSDAQYEGSAGFTPVAGEAFKNKLDTITVSGPYVVSNAQCSFLAELLGRFRHGRAFGAQFMGTIPDWLFTGYFPGARVDVTVDGEVRAYLLDGWSLVCDRESAVWGCNLVFLGVVGVTPNVVTPPITVIYPVAHAITAPSPQISATVQVVNTVAVVVTAPSPVIGANVNQPGTVTAAITGPSPVVSASIAEPGALSIGITAPSPVISMTLQDSVGIIASLVGRFRADFALNGSDNTATNGEVVKQLLNIVSGGTDGSIQATVSARPMFNSSSSNFNNQPTISSDGVDDFLEVPFGTLLTGDDFTLVHVFRFTTNASLQIGPRDTINDNSTLVSGYTSSNTAYYRVNSTILGTAYDIATESGTVARSYQFDKSGTAGEVFRDGGSRGTVTTAATKQVGDDIRVGQNGIFANFYALEWAETLVFSSALSTGDKATVDTYLSDRYGI